MIESLYVATSIIGYLTVRPSTNLIVATNAAITQTWWNTRREHFSLYISEVVLEEIGRGDVEMAIKRSELIRDFPLLEINDAVKELARQFLIQSNLQKQTKNQRKMLKKTLNPR
jgi:hypothetical protein